MLLSPKSNPCYLGDCVVTSYLLFRGWLGWASLCQALSSGCHDLIVCRGTKDLVTRVCTNSCSNAPWDLNSHKAAAAKVEVFFKVAGRITGIQLTFLFCLFLMYKTMNNNEHIYVSTMRYGFRPGNVNLQTDSCFIHPQGRILISEQQYMNKTIRRICKVCKKDVISR